MVKKKQNDSYEEIKYRKSLIAIIVRADYKCERTTFFSPNSFSQQLGYIIYKKGGVIKAHFHKKVRKKITLTQEVLFIKKGKLQVNFYTPAKKYISSRTLKKGDTIFLCAGSHGFKMLSDTEIIEVKQGPYSGVEDDKELFDGIENECV
ncbi:MAG: hypothetical protein WCZ89_01145 [Phycisphaerae bacterium]